VLRIRDIHPGSRILIFIHPGSNNSNKRGGGKISWSTFFVATNMTKVTIISFMNRYRNKIEPIQALIIWVWVPGSEIRENPIPDPGVKKAPIPDADPQHLLL
jgi:hypothetical protein